MTNHDSRQQTDSRHNHNIPPSSIEGSRSHYVAIGLGLAAVLAATAAGYSLTENLKSNTSAEAVNLEEHLRMLAREAILSGPENPNDIISTCTVDMSDGAYKAMYTAIDDAVKNQNLPEDVRDEMNRATYVGIETSAVVFNETLRDYATNTSITLFYKDIDNDTTQEILGTVADSAVAAASCQRHTY